MIWRKRFGLLLGVAGNALLVVAVFKVTRTPSCGGEGEMPCPSELTPFFAMLPAGIVLSVIGAFAGGPVAIFGMFVAIGLGSLAAAIFGDGEAGSGLAWGLGIVFTLLGLVALLVRAGRAAASEEERHLTTAGATGIGMVMDLSDTGVTINEDPRVVLTVRVEPSDGTPPFETRKTTTVSRVAIPRVGDRFPVFYDRSDRSRWTYRTDPGDDPSPALRALFEQAAGPAQAGAAVQAVAAAAPTIDGLHEDLSALNDLRMRGVITDAEFEAAKGRLLTRIAGGADAVT